MHCLLSLLLKVFIMYSKLCKERKKNRTRLMVCKVISHPTAPRNWNIGVNMSS